VQNTNDSIQYPKADFEIDRGKAVGLGYLINKLNFVNFIDSTVTVVYHHKTYGHSATLAVRPMPCSGPELKCRWLSSDETDAHLSGYRFDSLLVADNGNYIHVTPKSVHITPNGFNLSLPEEGYRLKNGNMPLNPSLKTEIFQKGVCFHGRLLNFSTTLIEVEIQFVPPQTYSWIDSESMVNLVLADGQQVYYSNECRIEKEHLNGRSCCLTLCANGNQYRRFKPKKHRSKRVVLQPSPDIVFDHPITRQIKTLKVDNLSGLGFSVTARNEDLRIVAGLIIPGIRLEMAGELLATCTAQIVHRCELQDDRNISLFRYGFAILDINIHDHTRLHKLVQQVDNPNAYVSNRVNQRELWEFFFETGFVYPQKYDVLEGYKERIKETYNKLYIDQPSFARHFIYQKEGVILGHMAILRFYSRAWMIHHHAARASNASRAGLVVLEQIGQFINESHPLDAVQMNFIFFFYRPENKFPSRVFGGEARFADDPQICSLDKFAYGHFLHQDSQAGSLPAPWALVQAQAEDLNKLRMFYEKQSGGLMLQAFDLEPEHERLSGLAQEYEQIGFRRERLLFALKKESVLKAIFEVNLSDVGLNMSDLTNCVRLFLVETDGISREILNTTFNIIAEYFDKKEVSVLTFPAENIEFLPMSIERHYMLWTHSLEHIDKYFAYTNRIVRFSSRK